MKNWLILLALLLITTKGFSQVKIHSHNDYEQSRPFHLAYSQKVYEIEADVFEVNGELLVSHTKKDINPEKTLSRLYLDPIDSLFKLYKGKVSADGGYTFSLMIDFKTDWQPTFAALEQLLKKYPDIFDRSRNKHAIQLVISGNRPADSTFHNYPRWVFFDGLPNISYAKADLKRVTMISDNLARYTKWKGSGKIPAADAEKIQQVIDKAHKQNKPVRFWGAPDTENSWRELISLGADIINTDQLIKSKHFLTDFKR